MNVSLGARCLSGRNPIVKYLERIIHNLFDFAKDDSDSDSGYDATVSVFTDFLVIAFEIGHFIILLFDHWQDHFIFIDHTFYCESPFACNFLFQFQLDFTLSSCSGGILWTRNKSLHQLRQDHLAGGCQGVSGSRETSAR